MSRLEDTPVAPVALSHSDITHIAMNGIKQHRNYQNEETIPLRPSSQTTLKSKCVKDGNNHKKKTRKDVCVVAATIIPACLALLLCLRMLLAPSSFGPPPTPMDEPQEDRSFTMNQYDTEKMFDEHGRFVLQDYDARPTFSDFLPGVAGIYGKPLWAFFVNRGQGIASFGTHSKNFPIMEFNAADKAYQSTALLGFRTFVRMTRNKNRLFDHKREAFVFEPFSPTSTRHVETNTDRNKHLPTRFMYVGSNEMQIQEMDHVNKLETNVTFFILPEEDFGAFVRRTTITNQDKQHSVTVDVLDGLARMEPAGGKLKSFLNTMSRTLEGWMGVYSPYNDSKTMPFYRLSTQPSDSATVTVQEHGHYCLSLMEENDSTQLLPIIYDTNKVFGEDTMLLRPLGLEAKPVGEILDEPQYGFAKTSSAFAALNGFTLKPGQSVTISSFYGKANKVTDVPVIARRVAQVGFVLYKLTRAREIINQITASVETVTSNHLFNGHVKQMFLDNSLRGGIPIILGEVDDDSKWRNADEDKRLKVYHLFSRIHGDLERDYNDFKLDPTFFSQGPGNFRDVAQNRRNDIFFNPRIGSFNIKMFLSFIQADGYEPLSVEAVVFTIDDKVICDEIAAQAVGYADGHRAQREALSSILNSGAFRPGQLFELMGQQNIELILSRQEFIDRVAAAAAAFPMAVFKSGYWADHFDYYMDMMESYLAIYPDYEERLLFDQALPYFFSPASVKPRKLKYVLSTSFDGKGKHVRQLNATDEEDADKINLQMNYIDNATGWFDIEANWQRDHKGNIFESALISKLFLLATIKFASRDPYGMGIEYEGGKPGWNDAMNGLPGMIGSGMPEIFELQILLRYILQSLSKYRRPIIIPVELAALIESIEAALDKLSDYTEPSEMSTKVPTELFEYWNRVASGRECYRDNVRLGFSGETMAYSTDKNIDLLKRWIREIDNGKARAIAIGAHGFGQGDSYKLPPTYFSFNVTKWKLTGEENSDGHPFVLPLKMEVGRFPVFLEAPVRMMKSVDKAESAEIYENVKRSGLRDEKLNMYTISTSLKGQSYDMGRMMAFSPGWLENQSVWSHMSYKFYLELLRNNLVEEFYSEMVSGGMLPFMDPEMYGRSLMECSSFIASSVFDDPSTRGRGFLARLSGSTAEFLSMWVLIMVGPKPFFVDAETREVRMQLLPSLPLWLFSGDNLGLEKQQDGSPTVSFKLFSSITVTYYNKLGADLFRVPPSRYVVGLLDGSRLEVDSGTIPFEVADKIRRVAFVDYIDAYFES